MSITCRLRSTPANISRQAREGYRSRSWYVTGGSILKANWEADAPFDCSTFYCKHGLKRALRQAFGKTCRAKG